MRAALPTLTYGHLAATIAGDRPTTIGYATRARHAERSVVITHHASDVAIVEPDRVHLNSHGYASTSTVQRLDQVLTDNGTPWRVAVRGGLVTLLQAGNLKPAGSGHFRTLTAERDADGWHLLAVAS